MGKIVAVEASVLEQCLEDLNAELRRAGVTGEVCLYGGAVMCLAYQARPSTRDVDAIFEPAAVIRQAAAAIAERRNLPADWLNDAVKGFLVPHGRKVFKDMECLKVYIPDPEYLLAMKCLAARVDTQDQADVRFLIRRLGLTSAPQVLRLVESYYPHRQVKPATRFFVEEIFSA